MRITYDKQADAVYIYIQNNIKKGGVAKTYMCDTADIDGMINLDFDEQGRLIGIEIMDASKKLPKDLLDSDLVEMI